MLVTSAVHDLEALAALEGLKWRECLMAGVGFCGPRWPSFHAAATYLVAASDRLGLTEEMEWAGYNAPAEWRTRPIKPKTLIKFAATRDETREQRMRSASLKGTIFDTDAVGGKVFVGGEISKKADETWSGSFVYPFLPFRELTTGKELLRTAATLLDAQYGFFFVRDDWARPYGYCHGTNATLAFRQDKTGDKDEIHNWPNALETYWSNPHPKLRDLFQLNLLADCHLSRRLGSGTLAESIW